MAPSGLVYTEYLNCQDRLLRNRYRMLGIVSYWCEIVTLSLRRGAVFPTFDFIKCRDLEIRVRGHSRSSKVVPFDRLGVWFPISIT